MLVLTSITMWNKLKKIRKTQIKNKLCEIAGKIFSHWINLINMINLESNLLNIKAITSFSNKKKKKKRLGLKQTWFYFKLQLKKIYKCLRINTLFVYKSLGSTTILFCFFFCKFLKIKPINILSTSNFLPILSTFYKWPSKFEN